MNLEESDIFKTRKALVFKCVYSKGYQEFESLTLRQMI